MLINSLIMTTVQIHFCNDDHWVVSSYLNGIISLYDSRPSRTITAGLQIQLGQLYGHLESSIEDSGLTIHHVPVQLQEGSADCGLFAIAFALHAALGNDLKEVTFEQEKLRGNVVSCFSNSRLTGFPTTTSAVKRACKEKVPFTPLYCKCRLPESHDNL